MNTIKRVILIVLDGFGVGALPDAKEYEDENANTLTHIYNSIPNFHLPNLAKLGLYFLITNYKPEVTNYQIIGCYGKMAEMSKGKDTTTGHWELAGLILENPFPTYPAGFPEEIIKEFEHRIGKKTLGNFACSGTEILKILGEEHLKTGYPIVYTSADSVFQIAAHEEVIPLKELYRYCEIARELLGNPPFEQHKVGRVIARPFIGTNKENFKRTENRRDFSIKPFSKTLLDYISEQNGKVVGIGKIEDIFANQGITLPIHSKNNTESIQETLKCIENLSGEKILIFTNLVDFDMLWGHRRVVQEYYEGLKYFDSQLEKIISLLKEDDLLIITSDHGNDPCYLQHTDHTREYVPLLLFSKNPKFNPNINLGVRKTFTDVAKTIDELFCLNKIVNGESFVKEIFK
ncbi:MAG: phosphopentomutase [Endomicrobia bacterium]|nr:phosphopentomutase [Endomicrobiia bacterium]